MSVTRSSDTAVQHREGPDLDALVEQIAAEHPAPVRFLDVDRVRRGGVMGFFAKEQYALSYQVADDTDTDTGGPATPGRHEAPVAQPVDLEALLGSADSRDVRPSRPTLAAVPDTAVEVGEPSPADDRFAELLLRLAAEDTGERPPPVRPLAGRHQAPTTAFEPLQSTPVVSRHRAPHESVEPAGPVLEPTPEPPVAVAAPVAELVAAPAAEPVAPPVAAYPPPVAVAQDVVASVPTEEPLAALGVPAGWGTDADDVRRAADVVAAVLALPAAPCTPTAAGSFVVLLTDVRGPHDDALRHLTALAAGGTHTATDRDTAVRAVADLRAGDAPGVLVVRTDRTSSVSATIAALQPDLTVLQVEATGKTSDQRRRLDAAAAAGLRVDALAVVRATETASPASVWELGVPVLSVDGGASDVGTWAGLLLAADRD